MADRRQLFRAPFCSQEVLNSGEDRHGQNRQHARAAQMRQPHRHATQTIAQGARNHRESCRQSVNHPGDPL
jgi:hypothetical protein